jgi:hypothetical protein
MERWKKNGKMEKWNDGTMERWKNGKMERWKRENRMLYAGEYKEFSIM